MPSPLPGTPKFSKIVAPISEAVGRSPRSTPPRMELSLIHICLAGCRRAFAEAGAPFGEDLVFESDYYIADGCRAAERIVASDATAIFASSDNIALGVLKCLHAHGKRVPRDYSLVSYDNSAADALFEPALTAIEQDVEELADHALELLLARVEAKDGTPGPFEERVLPPRLVQNASVSRP